MLSKKCQYALHALIYLGEHQDSGLTFISEIAEQKKIPKKFLEAILLDLKNTNILGSKKRKGWRLLFKEKAGGDFHFTSGARHRRSSGDATMRFIKFLRKLRSLREREGMQDQSPL